MRQLTSASIVRLALVIAGFSGIVAAMTWPQIRHLDSVHDMADPLFSIWRIEWINHQILLDPRHLFDGNMFYPEKLVLTYSDPLILPALMAAPLVWLGVHPVTTYNLLLLSAFVLSGVTMFFLVRSLTGDEAAAWIAGTIFALYPYRMEHYGHLELQMAMWMPLALWALHRTLARGDLGSGLLTGLAFGLQCLSCLYYGCFFTVYITLVGAILWMGRGRPIKPIGSLAAGALLASILIAPVASAYLASRPTMGTRDDQTVREFSATPGDYLKPTYSSLVYGRWAWAEGGQAERQLFPRVAPLVLTAAALYPPFSAVRLAYAAALLFTVDASFGLNGHAFTWLRASLPPFKDIRSPARFSLLVGMTLAILAGMGAARLLARWPRRRGLLALSMLAVVMFEALSEPRLEPVWPEPPAIYAALTGTGPFVLAEFPMQKDALSDSFDPAFVYFSTWHWQRLVNGYSGFFPPSHGELLERVHDFPSDDSLAYLRSRGVSYVTLHGRFMHPVRFETTAAWLDARPDVQLVAKSPWRGAEARLYRIR